MIIPKLLATSVVRGSQQGESHGGIYLVDINDGTYNQMFDWNTNKIDFEGRGADRGLRGIAYYHDNIYIAASNEIFIFDQNFNIIGSLKNSFLKHCHEICVWQDILYITSTGFDSLVMYDLKQKKFSSAVYIKMSESEFRIMKFDPLSTKGPKNTNKIHLNSVTCDENGIYFSGRKVPFLFKIFRSQFGSVANIPLGTHNAQRFGSGIIYNDTEQDTVCFVKNKTTLITQVPKYKSKDILNIDKYLTKVARPSFGRGMAIIDRSIIAAGSSPSTVAIHDMNNAKTIHQLTISMDVRNAIHGLEVWPF